MIETCLKTLSVAFGATLGIGGGILILMLVALLISRLYLGINSFFKK